jgi:hypothetical protein
MKIIKKNNKLYKYLYKWQDKIWINGYKKMYGNFMIDSCSLLKMKIINKLFDKSFITYI